MEAESDVRMGFNITLIDPFGEVIGVMKFKETVKALATLTAISYALHTIESKGLSYPLPMPGLNPNLKFYLVLSVES